jgi:hypothetical protein
MNNAVLVDCLDTSEDEGLLIVSGAKSMMTFDE